MFNSSRPIALTRLGIRSAGLAFFMGALAAGVATPTLMPQAFADATVSPYTYKDTRDLVSMVEDAAALLEAKGEDAFREFDVEGSRWRSGDRYLFVYRDDGTSVFHPISTDMIGSNMLGLKDIDGKPIIQEIVDIAKAPAPNASGWVFYHWQDNTQLSPLWKGSYVRKAVAPDGKVYLVGSGLYAIKIERSFVQDRVDLACDELIKLGKDAAFAEFKDPASPFVFLGNYISVLNDKGETLVDPAFPNRAGRNLMDFKDAVGFQPVKELMNRLETADTAWVQFLWPKPGEVMPSRKLIYGRKIQVGGETLIVGSDFFIATPIWMKVENSETWQQNQPG